MSSEQEQVEARTLSGVKHWGMTVTTRSGAQIMVQNVTHHAQNVIVWAHHGAPLVIVNTDLVTLTDGGAS